MTEDRVHWLSRHILPHESDLRAWLAGKTGADVEVDDVVQEAYAIIYSLEQVSHIRQPRAYMFTTARSIILQHYRRARIVPIQTVAELERITGAVDELTPEHHAIAGEDLRKLGRLVSRLPRKCRQAFLMRKVDGLSQREIARSMRISESTVEKHIAKGLRVLMEGMRDGIAEVSGSGGWAPMDPSAKDRGGTNEDY